MTLDISGGDFWNYSISYIFCEQAKEAVKLKKLGKIIEYCKTRAFKVFNWTCIDHSVKHRYGNLQGNSFAFGIQGTWTFWSGMIVLMAIKIIKLGLVGLRQ